MTLDLEQCVEAFSLIAIAQGYDRPEGAAMNCAYASDAFKHLLREMGIASDWVLLEHPDYLVFHIVPLVGDLTFDWTYRQFEGTSEFPRIRTLSALSVDGWREVTGNATWNKIRARHHSWCGMFNAADSSTPSHPGSAPAPSSHP